MDLNHIKWRVGEIFTLLHAIRKSTDDDTKRGNEIIKEVREEEDENQKIELVKQFKKLQFFNNFKLDQMEKIIPGLLELVSLAKVLDVELDLTDEQEAMIHVNKHRFAPMYVYDKNELIFMNKDLEEVISNELEKPSATDMEAINNIINAINGKK